MFSPFVPPGMEKPHDPVCARLDASKVGPLHQVAVGTGQRQVFSAISATMLPRDDVLDMELEFGKLLREVAGTHNGCQPGGGPTRAMPCPSGSLRLLQQGARLGLQKTQD